MLTCSALLYALFLLFSERIALLDPNVTLEFESNSNTKVRKCGQKTYASHVKLYFLASIVLCGGCIYWLGRKGMKDVSGNLADRPIRNESEDCAVELPDKPTKNNWKAMRRNSQVPQHFSSAKVQKLLGSDGAAYENAREQYYKNQIKYSDYAMGKASTLRPIAYAFEKDRQASCENDPTKPKLLRTSSRSYVGGYSAAAYEAAKEHFYEAEENKMNSCSVR